MGDGDEGTGAFGEAFAAEGGDAVFSDDVLDKVAGGDDAGAFSEDRVDLRAAFFRHGRDGDEGLAAFREGASVHEVVLAADAGDDAGADRIGAYLTGEVDLDCGVDGHYRRVLRDAERVIGPCDVLQEEVLTIVHIVIEAAGTEGQGGH